MAGFMKRLAHSMFVSGQRNRAAKRLRDRRSLGQTGLFETLEPRQLLSANPATKHFAHTQYVLTQSNGNKPLASSSPVGLTPTQVRTAYGMNLITFSGGIVGDGSGQTIAIVDAYHDPTILHDLQVFDAAFGLPDPPSFLQVAQNGTTNFPPTDPAGSQGSGGNTWEIETTLDVEWAHAMAPGANILLVEATDPSDANLIQAAVNYARNYSGVVAVSMSFGGDEDASETGLDTYFTTPSGHTGVTFLASTGDTGQPGGYPAYSPNVVAVGGTTLSTDGSGNYLGETGWSDSGGGISNKFEPQPSYQVGVVTQSSQYRTTPDVSMVADPATGVAIYDSYDFGSNGWIQVGGTSLSAPLWAGLIAVADQGRNLAGLGSLDGRTQTLPLLYQLPATDFHDITSGNNGFSAAAGYDLVTGRGSPKADLVVAGLLGSSISGTVFNDANGDGQLDNGESGQAGVTVFDDLNNNGVLDVGGQTTFNSTNVPVTIPDLQTITSTLTVSGVGSLISDVNVKLNINHTYDSDLVITLISPTGTQVILANHNGGSRDNFTNTTFDDQAATSISSGLAPFSGTYRPIGSLSALNGADANGTWTLKVADTVAIDSGKLNSWSLQIGSATEFSVVSDANGNYSFINVTPGQHHIRELIPATFVQSAPPGGVYDLNVAVGASLTGINFGNASSAPPPPVPGDFNHNGYRDAGDIAAAMMALANVDDYFANYSVTPTQLDAVKDVNQDGQFTNADLQYLLNLLIAQGGGSSSSLAHQTASWKQPISAAAITSEGFTDPRPAATVAKTSGTSVAKTIPALWKRIVVGLQDRPAAERLRLLRLSGHLSSASALEKFFETWVA